MTFPVDNENKMLYALLQFFHIFICYDVVFWCFFLSKWRHVKAWDKPHEAYLSSGCSRNARSHTRTNTHTHIHACALLHGLTDVYGGPCEVTNRQIKQIWVSSHTISTVSTHTSWACVMSTGSFISCIDYTSRALCVNWSTYWGFFVREKITLQWYLYKTMIDEERRNVLRSSYPAHVNRTCPYCSVL